MSDELPRKRKITKVEEIESVETETVMVEQEPQYTAEIEPTTVAIEIELAPCFFVAANVKRKLNMTKRLTERQSKALKAMVNLHPNQTATIQHLLDTIADAIEAQCKIKL
jgi:hypothetical protein